MPDAPSSQKVSQVRNVLANWGSFSISALAGLFLSPFVVAKLGSAGYGVWVLVGSLTGSLNIFDLGLRSAVTRFVARHHARSEHAAASSTASAVSALFLIAGASVLVVSIILAAGLPRWFNVPASLAESAQLILLISALTLAVVISNGLYGGVITGLQRLDLLGVQDIGIELLRVSLVLAVLSADGGLVGLALVGLLLALSRRAILIRQTRRLYPELGVRVRWPSWPEAREVLSVSAYSTLIYGSVSAMSQAMSMVVGAVLPLSSVAYYAIGTTLPGYAYALNRPIAQAVHPQASRFDALGDSQQLRRLILDTGRYSALVLLPLALTFLIRGATFIGIWMGDEFRGPSGLVLAIVSVRLVFFGTRHVMQAAFVGSGRHKSLGGWYVAEAVVMLCLAMLAVPRLGIAGAAWSGVVPSVALSVFVLPWLGRREFGVPMTSVWLQYWARPILAMAPFAFVSVWIDRHWSATSYLEFFAQVAVAIPFALAGAYLVGLSASERVRLAAPVRARLTSLMGNRRNG